MARKGLPKKYARMGFKRGWAAYKRAQRKPARKRTARRKTTKKRRYNMARRKKYYRRARYGGGKYKPMIDGLLAGAIERFAGQYIPVPGAVKLGVGIFRNNQTLTTLGALQLVNSFMGGNGNGGGGVR